MLGIYDHQQRAGALKCNQRLAAMRRRGQRIAATPRNSSGRVWASCISSSNCSQGFSSWVLLADCASSGQGLGKILQRLSEIQGKESSTGISVEDYPNCMAVCSLGSGYGWSIQDGPRWYDTSSGGHRQVYQVDRSSSDQKVGWSDWSPVYGRHHKQIWRAKQHHHRQRHKFRKGGVGTICVRIRHSSRPRICGTSSVKWSSGESKRPNPIRNQTPTGGAAGKSTRSLDR